MGMSEIRATPFDVMASGIGDLTFGTKEWVEFAKVVLNEEIERGASALADLETFTVCEVGHNPPAYLNIGGALSWYAKFKGASVEVGVGELKASECDFKIEADHSILSNIARIQYEGSDPAEVAEVTTRFQKLSKWKIEGQMPDHPGLQKVLGAFHDRAGARTMPRFVFMTPEWVTIARHLLTTRANSQKYASDLKDVSFTFSEEFTDTPAYAFPDGAHGGFWVHVDKGEITVGAGPLPKELEPADFLTKGLYAPIVPVGRTVVAAMNEEDLSAQEAYRKVALRYDKVVGAHPVNQSSPSGKGEMPKALARVFMPLHDEISKRTSGELPSDFDDSIKAEWATPQSFDRRSDYDATWVNYGRFDIYGNARG